MLSLLAGCCLKKSAALKLTPLGFIQLGCLIRFIAPIAIFYAFSYLSLFGNPYETIVFCAYSHYLWSSSLIHLVIF